LFDILEPSLKIFMPIFLFQRFSVFFYISLGVVLIHTGAVPVPIHLPASANLSCHPDEKKFGLVGVLLHITRLSMKGCLFLTWKFYTTSH
jgi:hypothetical protein